jgi:CRISPR-associated protein Cas1
MPNGNGHHTNTSAPPTAMDDREQEPPPLIPLAMLNAFVYCPRRFHYEFVQGVMEDNHHVVTGRRVHARVDDPALAERPRQEGDTIRTRSVWLTSLELGLTGKIDVVDEHEGEVCPVEYKKSRPPSREQCPQGYWPNDAVQLCAQGLLLESHGQGPVRRGFLYFATTRQRIEVPFTAELRDLTLAAVQSARQTAEMNEEPAPLVDSPKCPACSLVALCMPDETNRLRVATPADAQDGKDFPQPANPLRCLIPADYDRDILYVTEPGATLGKSGDQFVVRSRTGEVLAEVPGNKLRQVCIHGYANLTTQAVHACMDLGIDVAYFTTGGRLKGHLAPLPNANGLLRSAVARALQSEPIRLSMAREIIAAKIHNQRVMLMRNTRPDAKTSAFTADLAQMAELVEAAQRAVDRPSLLGVEGSAARLYFGNFNGMIRPDVHAWFAFENRNRRPPRDPVNAVLSLAYACLAKDLMSAVAAVGLDPYLGALHESRRGQPALALDLMEEFRPLVGDSVVLTLVNNAMVGQNDFLLGRQSCNLTDPGRKTFFAAYEKRKADECTHPVFQCKTSYVRLLEMQARILARFLTGQIPAYTGFRTR